MIPCGGQGPGQRRRPLQHRGQQPGSAAIAPSSFLVRGERKFFSACGGGDGCPVGAGTLDSPARAAAVVTADDGALRRHERG